MHKWLKRLLIGSGIFIGLLLLIALGVYLFVDINHYKKDIQSLMKTETGLDMHIVGDLKLSVINGINITARDISIATPQGLIADIARLDLKLDFRTLLKSQPNLIDEITLDIRQLKIKRDQQGHFNFLPRTDAASRAENISDHTADNFLLKAIHLNIDTLIFEDEVAALSLHNQHLVMDLSLSPVIDPSNEVIDQQIHHWRLKSGRLELKPKNNTPFLLLSSTIESDEAPLLLKSHLTEGSFTKVLRHFAQKGALEISTERIEFKQHAFNKIHLELIGKHGRIDLLPFTLNFSDAPVKGQAHIELANQTPTWNFQVQGQQVNLWAATQLFARQQVNISGKVDIANTFSGTGFGANFKIMRGEIDANGIDIQLKGFDMDAILTNFENSQSVGLMDVGAYALLGPAGTLINKGHDYRELSRSVKEQGNSQIKQIRTHILINQGIARMQDVALASAKHRLVFKGQVDLNQQKFTDFQVATVDTQGCVIYKESVAGHFNNPEVHKVNILLGSVVNPVTSVLSKLTDPLIGRCQTPFYSGSVKSP